MSTSARLALTAQSPKGFKGGEIESVSLYDNEDGSIFRAYNMVKDVKRDGEDIPSAPTTTSVIENTEDSTGATNGRMIGLSWTAYHQQADPSQKPSYRL